MRLRAFLQGLLGLLLGLIGGALVTVAFVVARARFQGAYFHDADELLSWVGVPLVLGPVAGAWMGISHPPGHSVIPGAAVGLSIGVALGAALGTLGDDPSWRWAGLTMGGAAGLVLGVWVALLRHFRRRRRALDEGLELGPRRSAFVAVLITAAFLAPLAGFVAAASSPDPPSAPHVEAEPDSAEVEAVVLLLGDGGNARRETSPVLARATADVERWSARLADSSVVVLYLGDNVYPSGLPDPEAATWAEDSAKVADQASVVNGAMGRARGARALFLAGNHDWGERTDFEGAVRLGHLDRLLQALAASGTATALLPPAGTGGPATVDVGAHLRLVLLDTAWWLLQSELDLHDEVLAGIEQAFTSAGERRIVIAAHHPYLSGGPHGGTVGLGETLGIRNLLSLSGALLQDLHSQPYVALRRGLDRIFAEHGPPALFAGGHEHSIQLLEGTTPTDPPLTVVSGAASKLNGVGSAPGMRFARSEPGYARLLVLRDGRLHLSLETTGADYIVCGEDEPARTACMDAGARGFRTVWSQPLSP